VQVIGLTRASGPADPLLMRRDTDFAVCAQSACRVVGFEKAGSAWAGGTAFNGDEPPNLTSSLGGVWISNGRSLAQVDPWNCDIRCAPQPVPLQSPAAEVTGLACWEAEGALLVSDSTNLLYWMSPSTCALSAVACASFKDHLVPSGYTIGGLATDDLQGRMFVSASTFGAATVSHKLWVADLGAPQRPIQADWCPKTACELTIPACPGVALGAITGLGFDACSSTLYLTDGAHILAVGIGWDPVQGVCTSQLVGCCNPGSPDRYTGLCVAQRPAESVGSSCVEAPCIACPAMRAGTYGAAFLGNRNFALTLRNAPTGATPAFVAVGLGRCSATGFGLGFCGAVRIDLTRPTLLIPVRVTPSGATACDGAVTISLGIPSTPGFCGSPVSVQWVMNCPGVPSGTGHAISNCVSFEMTTN